MSTTVTIKGWPNAAGTALDGTEFSYVHMSNTQASQFVRYVGIYCHALPQPKIRCVPSEDSLRHVPCISTFPFLPPSRAIPFYTNRYSNNSIHAHAPLLVADSQPLNSLEKVDVRKLAHFFNIVGFYNLFIVEQHPGWRRITLLELLANEGNIMTE